LREFLEFPAEHIIHLELLGDLLRDIAVVCSSSVEIHFLQQKQVGFCRS
jgi:hypothetical protein